MSTLKPALIALLFAAGCAANAAPEPSTKNLEMDPEAGLAGTDVTPAPATATK